MQPSCELAATLDSVSVLLICDGRLWMAKHYDKTNRHVTRLPTHWFQIIKFEKKHHNIKSCNLLCSHTFEMVQQQSIKTWSFYRYSLTEEYQDKPTLVPPIVILNHLWRIVTYAGDKCRRCCVDKETKDKSSLCLFIISCFVYFLWWTLKFRLGAEALTSHLPFLFLPLLPCRYPSLKSS